ncbi:Putative esterase [bacterium HR25]|jgi:uncharacterized protein (TIGR00369 family)|nr:Putative esterase [bacterium HR25]
MGSEVIWPTDTASERLVEWLMSRWPGSLMERVGVRMVELSPERAVGEMAVGRGVLTLLGSVHTGAMLTLADSVATFLASAIANRPGERERFPVAIDLSAQIVGNVQEGTLRAESVPLHRGRTIVVVQTRVSSLETGRLLAHVTSTHFVRPE